MDQQELKDILERHQIITLSRFGHRYGVSAGGDVYSFCNRFGLRKDPLVLKQADNGGYREVSLKIDGVTHRSKVHRLVAEAFLGLNPNSQYVVHHKNACKHDNRVTNLEICTVSKNAKYAAQDCREKFKNQRASIASMVSSIECKEAFI